MNAVAALIVGGVLALFGSNTLGFFGHSDNPQAAPSVSASARPSTIALPATASPIAAPTLPPTTKPAPTKPGMVEPAPEPEPTKPRPRPKPTRTTETVRENVWQGLFCTPQGARGVTVAGTPMACTTTAADEKKRWRQAP